MACVGLREEVDVALGEAAAPAIEAGLDLRAVESGGKQRPSDMRGRRVPRHIGTVGVRAVDLLQRCPGSFDVHLVMRQEQRSVDVEEHEEVQRTTASTASRNERTYSRSASGPSAAISTAREPTTMPSANSAAARACSGVEMPNPA